MQREVVVGSEEQHTVGVAYSRWSNALTVSVDGRSVQRDVERFWISKVRRVSVRVGQTEIHEVTVEKIRPTLWAKFKDPIFRISVDGSEIYLG